jgi:hypothetical protein
MDEYYTISHQAWANFQFKRDDILHTTSTYSTFHGGIARISAQVKIKFYEAELGERWYLYSGDNQTVDRVIERPLEQDN